jgi:hypothetical protein
MRASAILHSMTPKVSWLVIAGAVLRFCEDRFEECLPICNPLIAHFSAGPNREARQPAEEFHHLRKGILDGSMITPPDACGRLTGILFFSKIILTAPTALDLGRTSSCTSFDQPVNRFD